MMTSDTLEQTSPVEALRRRPSLRSRGRTIDAILPASQNPHSRDRAYRIYLPTDYHKGDALPLLMVLHGCRQTHLDIQRIAAIDAIADRERFIVLYPFVSDYAGLRTSNCWGWWLPHHRKRGSGEVEDLARIARQVVVSQGSDPTRQYICGLSSGACMSVISLVVSSHDWTAGASIAGVAYGESARAVRLPLPMVRRHRSPSRLNEDIDKALGARSPPPLMMAHSTSDAVVSTAVADGLKNQWILAADLESTPHQSLSGVTRGTHWRLNDFGRPDRAAHEGDCHLLDLRVDGLPHGWFGGRPGAFSSSSGPNLSELAWQFLSKHRSTDR